ncbi:MAG: hypothetical protein AAFR27_02045 [Pseudomonadota bacterium]
MSIVHKMMRTLLIIAGALIAIPLAVFLAVVALVVSVACMAFGAVRDVFRGKPRWDDAFNMHTYEAEAVRVDNKKMNKRPIIIDHE